MLEEAEALLHSSKVMNKNLKTCLTLSMLVAITAIQFACLDAVIGTMTTAPFFVGILFDNLSLLIGMVLFGLYSDLPDQAVQILGAVPFLFMIFFSTTFSPGSGVKVRSNPFLLWRRNMTCGKFFIISSSVTLVYQGGESTAIFVQPLLPVVHAAHRCGNGGMSGKQHAPVSRPVLAVSALRVYPLQSGTWPLP